MIVTYDCEFEPNQLADVDNTTMKGMAISY